MANLVNRIYKIIYVAFMVTPFLYVSVAAYSYFSVLNKFGRVPYNDTLYKIAGERNTSIGVFPISYGGLLLSATFVVYLISPIFVLANYLVHRAQPKYLFFKKHALALLLTCLYSFFLITRTDQFGGWYLGLIAD